MLGTTMERKLSGFGGTASLSDGKPPMVRKNSRFIPEPERGWYVDAKHEVKQRRNSSAAHSSSSKGTFKAWRNGYLQPLSAKFASPRARSPSLVQDPGNSASGAAADANNKAIDTRHQEEIEHLDDEEDSPAEQEEDNEEEEQESICSHSRERSNSVPDLPSLQHASSKQTSSNHHDRAPMAPPLKIDLSNIQSSPQHHVQLTAPPTPLMLTLQNSITPSLELQPSRSVEQEVRGYAWRSEHTQHSRQKSGGGGGFVPPGHRNPTALQAFYDTHFGSSSGLRSVAGLADDFFHPIGSAKHMLSKLTQSSSSTASKRGKEPAQPIGKADEDEKSSQSKDSLMSWRALPFSPAIFGMGSSSEETSMANKLASTSKTNGNNGFTQDEITNPKAYEPELVPTIHRDPHANRYFKNLQGNVVVMGGYRGSILRDAETHQMIWVPLKVGVGLRRPTLELGLSPEAEDTSEDLVVPDEMLAAIGNMVDSGKRLLARCSRKRTQVHSFGFDWRLSLARSSKRLQEHLERLWEESSSEEADRKGAKVVAHSMGGLVALHALSQTQNPRIFDALVFASTPFLGTANILGPFAFGDAALWNDEICSPRATFSFRSSFYLLPTNAKTKGGSDTAGGQCFEEEDGTVHDVDFLDPTVWDDLGFSRCIKRGARSKWAVSGEAASNHAPLDKAENVPALPLGVQMTTSREHDGKEGELQDASELAKQGLSHTVKAAKGADDTKQTLQPANQPKESATNGGKDTEDDEEKEDRESWMYLEKTLADARQFFFELRTGFKQEFADKGLYPPIAILTSGRTPTVRGALVWPRGSAELERQEAKANVHVNEKEVDDEGKDAHWKRSVRLGDYSRMLYAPGDGVILRKSATTLPGLWSKLLVRSKASVDEHTGLHALTNDEGVVETSHRHVTLLSDVDGIGRCLEACRRARINGWL